MRGRRKLGRGNKDRKGMMDGGNGENKESGGYGEMEKWAKKKAK